MEVLKTIFCAQGLRLLVLPVILLVFILPDYEFYPVLSRPFDPHRPPKFDRDTVRKLYLNAIRRLTAAGFNFSHIGDGLRLTLKGKLLNKRNLKLTTADAMDILPMLHDQNFEDRMYVWGKTAAVCAFSESAVGRIHSTYPVPKLDMFEGDILLNRDQADRFVSDFPFRAQQAGQIYLLSSGQVVHGLHRKAPNQPWPEAFTRRRTRFKRKMIANEDKYWSGAIPWKIVDPAFSMGEVEVIRSAFRHWEELTCIRFEEITDPSLNFTIANKTIESRRITVQQAVAEANASERRRFLGRPNLPAMAAPVDLGDNIGPHLQFKRGQGCYSYTGKVGSSGQEVSIGEGCAYMGIVSHEIGHAIGFYHEQNRPDRDVYIKINASNVKDFHMRDFNMYTWEQVITNAVPYDYSSLMHYGTSEWSRDNKPTIIAKDSNMQKVLGQRERLSFFDAKLANFQFCSVACDEQTLEWSECKHGGYRNPNECETCVCPPGWAPPTCTDIESGRNTNCGDQLLFASSDPQTLESPGYQSGLFERNIFCAWLIQAPVGKRIRVEVNEEFTFEDTVYTCEDYLEVRYEGVDRTGPRLCSPENVSHVFVSLGHEIMLLMNTIRRSTRGFTATYRVIEGCGGCAADAMSLKEPMCQKVEKYNCSGIYYAICDNGRPCAKIRENYCFRKVDFCCDPYEKDDDICKWKWGPWTDWSACSATCGGCGTQTRERQCLNPPCKNDAYEVRACAMKMCPLAIVEVTKKCRVRVEKQCNWNWWGFLPCFSTRQPTLTCDIISVTSTQSVECCFQERLRGGLPWKLMNIHEYQTCTNSYVKRRCCGEYVEDVDDVEGECKLKVVDTE